MLVTAAKPGTAATTHHGTENVAANTATRAQAEEAEVPPLPDLFRVAPSREVQQQNVQVQPSHLVLLSFLLFCIGGSCMLLLILTVRYSHMCARLLHTTVTTLNR